jgi:hypothetical protein
MMTQREKQIQGNATEPKTTLAQKAAIELDEMPADVKVDPHIKYPSYKSFDEFIDVEQLKSLDGYITQRIKRRLQAKKDYQFYTGPYKLDNSFPDLPGSRMIYLAYSEQPDSYFDLDKTELWHRSEAANEYSLLMNFIETLPFQATGRMLIMYDDVARPVPPHRDHIETELCHEFVWFRTNLRKPFYMLNHETNEKQYVDTYTAWFDSVNQFHGSDPVEGLSFSIRVDGRFTDEFRARIPKPEYNLASTPSFWACLSLSKNSK